MRFIVGRTRSAGGVMSFVLLLVALSIQLRNALSARPTGVTLRRQHASLTSAFSFPHLSQDNSRREVLSVVAPGVVGGLLSVVAPTRQALAAETDKRGKVSVFKVKPDSSAALSPELQPVEASTFRQALASGIKPDNAEMFRHSAKGGAVWLGEHHNSASDHKLQAEIIRWMHEDRRRLRKSGPMAIGLEQVQVQFQPVLDDFVAGTISEDQLCERVEWKKRWTWPFEGYRPVFDVARELKIPLIALNVNSEDLARVEKAGLPGLSRQQLETYIQDREGFAAYAKPVSYSTYVNYVIKPSYDLHKQMGLLKYTMSGEKLEEEMSFRNFFSGRILWDEAMASGAYSWTKNNPGGILVGLVGSDHVKFDGGITGRYSRMAGVSKENLSVMLNPTLIDTRPSGSLIDTSSGVVGNAADSDSAMYPERITLQLRYLKEGVDASSPNMSSAENTGGVLPLADYVVVGM